MKVNCVVTYIDDADFERMKTLGRGASFDMMGKTWYILKIARNGIWVNTRDKEYRLLDTIAHKVNIINEHRGFRDMNDPEYHDWFWKD